MAQIVCIHGLGGTGATVEPLAERLRHAGHSAITVTLPGHGTTTRDLIGVTWQTWLDAIPPAEVLIGQSMGASLALAAAACCPEVRGVVCINGLAPDPDAVDGLEWRQSRGHDWLDAPPAAEREQVYEQLPIEALIEMARGVAAIPLAEVRQPVLVVTGLLDDVVDPANSDLIADGVAGPVERLTLISTGHVATLGPQLDVLATRCSTWLTDLRLDHLDGR